MFWLLATALTIIIAISILLPFWRSSRAEAEPAAAFDLRVYRGQLQEVERDLSRGVIDQAEAGRLRAEIGRKILEADRALAREKAAQSGSGGRHGAVAIAVLVGLIAAGAGIYAWLGAPARPDMPLASRITEADERYASRPTQQEAEAEAARRPRPDLPEPDPEFAQLIDQLRAAVAERPDDPQGLALLARNEVRLGNVLAAKEAQARLVTVLGDRATAEDHAFLAGLMAEAAGGVITSEAEAEVARALQLDPQNTQARYMAGLLEAQNGRPDRAFPIWAQLLEDTPSSSPWAITVRQVIGDVAWMAGEPNYVPPEMAQSAPAMPGPDADAMAAAADMTPEDRAAFVRSMVDQLQDRLATEGGSAEEWARLISALGVLGDTEQAGAIHAEAQARFADQPEALALIDAAAAEAGLGE